MTAEVAWDLVSAITVFGAEKIKDFDGVEVTEENGIRPGFDPSFGSLFGAAGRDGDFIFLGESLSKSRSVSQGLFNGLLLLLFRSSTSLGMGLGSGEIFFVVFESDLVKEELSEAWGFALPKLNTGSVSTFSCVVLTTGGGGAVGQGGALDVRSTLLRPESVTLDFILRLDLVEVTIALSLGTLDSSPDVTSLTRVLLV